MQNVILVLVDGLEAGTAHRCMSYMSALTEAGIARHTTLDAELPPLSRPIYATLLTGLPPTTTGVTGNDPPIATLPGTIFHKACRQGLRTAAAAFFWMSELCNRIPFDAARDRFSNDPNLPISHGLFYVSESYPDRECFLDAEALRRMCSPHLLLVHPMGVDTAGHACGVRSSVYRDAVRHVDDLLAAHLPGWLEEGFCVIVTGDHGMDEEGRHHDATALSRQVPFWMAGASLPIPASQHHVAGLMEKLLGITS
ncbi:MAG: alkaline phosphatase family protein [Desulfovibrio sp.]|jgi:predicted AlkP superfamily pyrophosphatase or phosphodiesterase|nr:alkaline phosphatase family protein [Desulfovibrio sp.]